MKKTWNISLDGKQYNIQYQGQKLSGVAKVLINGEYFEYSPTLVKKVGMFVKLDISDKDVVLKMSLNGKEINLIVDGQNFDIQEPVQHSSDSGLQSGKENRNTLLQRKVKTGLGSYIAFVVFTYVNLVLILQNSSLKFPFSAMMPVIPLYFGQQFYYEEGIFALYMIGIVVSIIFASVYLLLYFLSRKRVVPILITIIFVIIDTVVLVLLSLDDIAASTIDIIFHIWVLIAMINLFRARLALNKTVTEELTNAKIIDDEDV